MPQPGQTFPILEAAGGVTGTFATVVSPWSRLSPMLRFEALYRANDVRLSLTQLPFAAVGLTPEQQAVGAGVDGAIARGTIPNLQRALNALPELERVGEALAELSPGRYTRWFDQAVYSAGATVRAIEQRLEQAPREPRGGLWLDVVRREGEFAATAERTAATATGGGLLVGGDVRAVPGVQAGLLFGYTAETLALDEAGSETEVARFNVSAYTRFDWAPAFLELVVGGTHAELDSRRRIEIPGYNQQALATTRSRERYASVRAGYTFGLGQTARLTPYAGLGYVGWATDATNETGAREANLRLAAQSRSSLAARTGLLVAVPFVGEEMSITPRLDVGWRHEFREQSALLSASLGGSRFRLPGEGAEEAASGEGLGEPASQAEGRKANGFTAGVGLDVTFGARLNTYLRLATERATAVDRALEARAGAELRF